MEVQALVQDILAISETCKLMIEELQSLNSVTIRFLWWDPSLFLEEVVSFIFIRMIWEKEVLQIV